MAKMGLQYLIQGFLFFSLVTGLAPSLQAAPEIGIRLHPSHSLKKGETCQLTIDLFWRSAEAQYSFVFPEIPLQNLSLEEVGETNETYYKDGEEWRRKIFRATLRAVQTGHGEIGPFQIAYVDPASQKGGRLEVSSKNLRIQHDLTRVLGLTLAGLVGGIAALGWVMRRRREQTRMPSASLEQSIEERYLTELGSPGDAVDISKIARILQSYLCDKYMLTGNPQMTVPELAGRLQDRIPYAELKRLGKILQDLEEKRFAVVSPRPGEVSQLRTDIIRYIEGKRTVSV